MINFYVYVYNFDNNTWEKQKSVFPFKWADLLDERLDEVELSFKAVKTEYFKPLQFVKVEIINNPPATFSQAQFDAINARAATPTTKTLTDGKITETVERFYLVASDNSVECIGIKTKDGLKTYNHELYGIELTKIMEGFIGDTITFTNPLGHNYTGDETLSVSLTRLGDGYSQDGYSFTKWRSNTALTGYENKTVMYKTDSAEIAEVVQDDNTAIWLKYLPTTAFAVAIGATIAAVVLP